MDGCLNTKRVLLTKYDKVLKNWYMNIVNMDEKKGDKAFKKAT